MDLDASRALMDRAARVMPGGISSYARQFETPRSFDRGGGAHVWDVDGNEYVDFLAAWGAITLGHCDPRVNEAVAAALEEQDLFGMGTTELEIEVASMIANRIPCAERVLFGVSGTEVVSSAIRLARGVTDRPKIVKFQGHYHGSHDSLVLNQMSDPAVLEAGGDGPTISHDPFTTGVLDSTLAETIVLPFNDPAAVEATFESHGDEIAAVILEPVAHNMGVVPPAEGYLETLRRLTADHGSLLVFDEIVTGFRHDPGGVQAIEGVTPDLATFGKSVANGYPLSVLCGRADLMERFQTTADGDVAYGGTYNAHAGSLAAARETIRLLESDDFYGHGAAMSRDLADGLSDLVADRGITATVRRYGTVFLTYFADGSITSYADVARSNADAYAAYRRAMCDCGVLMVTKPARRNYLTASHTDADIATTLEAADEALRVAATEAA